MTLRLVAEGTRYVLPSVKYIPAQPATLPALWSGANFISTLEAMTLALWNMMARFAKVAFSCVPEVTKALNGWRGFARVMYPWATEEGLPPVEVAVKPP
jgi:hypothetical protein